MTQLNKQEVIMNDPRKADRMYQESIKSLRTNLLFAGVNIKTIAVTSCFPNEGKSDIAFQLCKELGVIDKKVLLLDCDIRKSSYVTRFGVDKAVKGLSHYLSGQAKKGEIIYSTNNENVDIIFCGSTAPNPAELLESEMMGQLVSQLREAYDYIIIDTPPLASVTDAQIVAKWCDGSMLVIESGKVSHKDAERAVQQLKQSGCSILGAVLNKVDTRADRYYSRYGYYRKYGYYSKYGYGGNSEKTEK